jgi:hypothetical protein
MTTEVSVRTIRDYLLGQLPATEAERLDELSIADDTVAEQISAAEHDLVDAYVRGELRGAVLEQFRATYLTTPRGREAIGFAEALQAHDDDAGEGGASEEGRGSRWRHWLAAAAAILVLASASVWLALDNGSPWMLRPQSSRETAAVRTPPPAVAPVTPPPAAPGGVPDRPAPPPAPPVVIALSISPILVRGADAPPSLTIEPGTDLVRLLLQGEPAGRRLGRGRAIVRTVAGGEVWRGAAAEDAGAPSQALARLDIPPAHLPPDDYIVVLLGTGADGREVERYRYFFRVLRP